MIVLQWLVLVGCAWHISGAKIMAFLPFPAKSHHFAFQPMIRELAMRGHDVTYVTPVPMKNPPKNLKEVMVEDKLQALHDQIDMKGMMSLTAPGQTILISEMGRFIAEKLLTEDAAIKQIIDSTEKYDVILLEHLFGQEWASVFPHKFNALGVGLVPLFDASWVNEMSGLPDNPSYMIDFKARTTDKLSFLEKLHNMYILASTILLSYYYSTFPMQSLADKYIRYEGWETRPSVVKLSSDMALVLVNSHLSLGYAYPKAPHVKEVGGMNLAPNKPLPKDLQNFMDSATNGVIYFSYGSNVNVKQLLMDGKLGAFVEAFKKLKQKVLWKWKGSEIPKIDAPNVMMQEWFPQQDILAHKNMAIFMTHGGLMSIIEAINVGVPLIGTAVFGDQPKNMRFVEHAGIGINLNYDNISTASVSWAINHILTNPEYKQNMAKQSALFKDRPMQPVQEAVYWIEYVAKHGKALQPASVHMPWYQLYLLDVLGAILAAIFLTLFILKRIFKAICSLCHSKQKERPTPSKKRQ